MLPGVKTMSMSLSPVVVMAHCSSGTLPKLQGPSKSIKNTLRRYDQNLSGMVAFLF